MTKILLVALACVLAMMAALMILTPPAYAAPQCVPHTKLSEGLARNFGETVQAMGIAGNGTMIEVFANSDNGTWSIVQTTPGGVACLVASGGSFEAVMEDVTKEGVPG